MLLWRPESRLAFSSIYRLARGRFSDGRLGTAWTGRSSESAILDWGCIVLQYFSLDNSIHYSVIPPAGTTSQAFLEVVVTECAVRDGFMARLLYLWIHDGL